MIPGLEREAERLGVVTLQFRKILVVDEAPPVRRKLRDILSRAGVSATEILTAETAEAALEVFALEGPMLVFCELVGGPAEGLAMVLEMLHVDPQAKVVLLTAEDPGSAVVRQAIRAGVFGVVKKPLRHEAIRSLLAEIGSEDGGIERLR